VSRRGGISDRLLRYASGGEVNEDVTPRVSYSREAVDDFIAEIAGDINRDPVNASIEPSGDSVQPTPAAPGISVREDKLRDAVTSAVESPVGTRRVEPQVVTTQPEITKKELAQEYPILVTIDRANFKLRLFRRLKLAKAYDIAVGQAGYDTPTGEYTVNDKQVNPTWYVPKREWAGDLAGRVIPPGPSNPLKARWIGITDGAGIHGTDDVGSIGSNASHGCIRMRIPDVVELYDRLPTGSTIFVQ
jgi:lipoprotein-anchoring transpeptidase ErfK/SrfK